ncbi:MAG: hypothetical protein ACSLEW_00655 [Nocardioides sp.]
MITEPVEPSMRRVLRRAVFDLAANEPRLTRFPPYVNVGTPGGLTLTFDESGQELTDHTFRTDVVAALVHRARKVDPAVPMVWLTRPGGLSRSADSDLGWGAATYAAFAEAGMLATYVVVTRHGWQDPFSGVGQSWVRPRRRSG